MRGPALQAAVERTSFDLDRVVRGDGSDPGPP